ncbi:MAG: nitroreductase family protein [Pseudomonadales bacterium]|nr:nitroreductase family protein [Pseudomonadales bacterium]
MNQTIEQIIQRQSRPRLELPAPNEAELQLVLRCGLRAPDHFRLKPWRFLVLQGAALIRLGETFQAIKAKELGELSEAQVQKFLNMPLRAPMIIVAIANIQEHPKVPPIEQAVAVGCAVQNMQLALASMGYGAMWRTGDLAFNPAVKEYFKAQEKDEIIGFLYVGTPAGPVKELTEQAIEEAVEFWS